MKGAHYLFLIATVLGVLLAATVVARLQSPESPSRSDAWDRMPKVQAHVDHSQFFTEPFAEGPAVAKEGIRGRGPVVG